MSLSFPSTDSAPTPISLHLPFRRISLPSAPSSSLLSAQQRQSFASFASFESLPEDPRVKPPKRRSLNNSKPNHTRSPAPEDAAREAKRAKVVSEFWDTERSYVAGLDLVHDHFLIPIIASLDTPRPLLTRPELTVIFSNFIDIWNFHHAFLRALTPLLNPQLDPTNLNPPSLSSLLLSHFPYLSLYTPFITAFTTSISFLAHPPPPFAVFLRAQERDTRCRKLKLADWLLTIVQRCPRYVLLLRELMAVEVREKEGEGEWHRLAKALALVEKVTSSLNASLHAHAHTLALLALQRATLGLPPALHFVQPGRTLIFRAPLVIDSGGVAIEGAGIARSRANRICEFLLFDDLLVWLDCEPSPLRDPHPYTPTDERHTYTYKNHLSLVDIEAVLDPSHHPPRIEVLNPGGSFAVYALPSSSHPPKHQLLSTSLSEPTLDTQTNRATTPLSPSSNDTLHTFLHLLRQARSALLARDPSVALRGVRMRGVLWAEAYQPEDGGEDESRMGYGSIALPENHSKPAEDSCTDTGATSPNRLVGQTASARPPRAPLPFLPPVWVPDAKTDACMRCARPFGFVILMSVSFSFPSFEWGKNESREGGSAGEEVVDGSLSSGALGNGGEGRASSGGQGMWRRRHHCRLCGRVVCAECSGRTFYITDPSSSSPSHDKKSKSKPARACNECYEAAFPLVRVHSVNNGGNPSTLSQSHNRPSPTLLGIPAWLSTPILTQGSSGADALMAMTLSPSRGRIAINASPSSSRMRLRLSSGASKRGVEGNANAGMSLSTSKRELTPSPAQHAHPGHIPRDLLVGALSPSPSSSLSPPLSPSSSRFSAPADDGDGVGDTDVPTVRIRHPSMRSSRATTASPRDSEEQPSHPTLRAFHGSSSSASSRPIRIRHSTRPRPRSYHDILEDFEVHARAESVASSVATSLGVVAEERASRLGRLDGGAKIVGETDIEMRRNGDGDGDGMQSRFSSDEHERGSLHAKEKEKGKGKGKEKQEEEGKRENTARKKKRFSLPAVAVQTVPVVARSGPVGGGTGGWGGVGRRLSGVLGVRAMGKEKEGSMRSSSSFSAAAVRDEQEQGGRLRSRDGKRGGEKESSSAARALMDVLRGRKGRGRGKA